MSRHLDKTAHDYVTLAPGAVPVGGPVTVVLVFRLDAGGTHDLMASQTAGSSQVWALNWSGGQAFATFGGGFRSGQTGMSATTWYMYAFSKAAGSALVRDHLCAMTAAGPADTWTHANMTGVIADGTGPIDHIWLGRAFGDYLGGNIAAAAVFAAVLSDGAVEALRPGIQEWVDAGAVALWVGDNAPITDLAGGGANQTAIAGTTVDLSTEPPAFSYTLGVTVTVNTRIVGSGLGAWVNPPSGGTPSVPAVVLVDGSGNIVKTVDNSDGTATLSSNVSVALEPAASTVAVALTGADQVIAATAKDYRGFSVRETTGTAAAVIRLYDNASTNSGTILEEIGLAPGESAREFYGDGGVKVSNGIYCDIVSGTVTGSVRTGQ